jgi:hypothetical protein
MQVKTITPLPTSVKPGVVTGKALTDLLEHAKTNGYAIPAVNVVSSCSISGCLEAAKKCGGPMIIQFSRGGGQFYAGKTADNTNDAASIAGCIAGALHVRAVARLAEQVLGPAGDNLLAEIEESDQEILEVQRLRPTAADRERPNAQCTNTPPLVHATPAESTWQALWGSAPVSVSSSDAIAATAAELICSFSPNASAIAAAPARRSA